VITHGHRHPKIVAAITAQAKKLDQVIFANFTHQPAEDAARGLIEIAPKNLTKVFFSDSGSISVEVALKMALGYWRAEAKPRHRIIALEHAYHGDTIGTMAVARAASSMRPMSRCCSRWRGFRSRTAMAKRRLPSWSVSPLTPPP